MTETERIYAIFDILSAHNPNPQTELYYVNTYTLLVAVVLSAQATDKGINKATGPLFDPIQTPHAMCALGIDALKDALKTIGLYKTKAAHVMRLSELLVEKHDGRVPDNREALEALPGVGRKTANVVLNVAFGHTTLAVDTHVFRVANRTQLASGKTPLDVEVQLLKHIPERFAYNAHHWLILHGRYICTARHPKCDACILNNVCPKIGI